MTIFKRETSSYSKKLDYLKNVVEKAWHSGQKTDFMSCVIYWPSNNELITVSSFISVKLRIKLPLLLTKICYENQMKQK